MTSEEGVLDPWVADWFAANPALAEPRDDWSPEMLALARGDFAITEGPPVAKVGDDVIAGVRVRVYEHDHTPAGVVVYFHGGGFCTGSIWLMDNVARELAHCADVAVVSVEYRLAPEHPYPAGLDDCEAVTRSILDDTSRFGAPRLPVVVAGESAGGSLATGIALRLRDAGDTRLGAQVLIYPGVAGDDSTHPSRSEFDGVLLTATGMQWFWDSYTGGRDLSRDPYAVPLRAESLRGLPPVLVVLGGCDVLRDEGREYARRLAADGVDVEEVCYPGQPHGFVNFGFPAAAAAFGHIGTWIRARLVRAGDGG
jgi:acetyl esterase